MKIKKAVIPVAGKGTRFLPITKEIPKEMIPILNRPMIAYVVEEAVLSGITEIIFVTSRGKESITNYFDRNVELENFLSLADKKDQELSIKVIGSEIDVYSVRQKEQLGLGHAINCAKSLIGDEPFVVLLGDDLICGEIPATKQLIDTFVKYDNSSVVGLFQVEMKDTDKYGVIDGDKLGDKIHRLKSMVEKPGEKNAPSNLAVPGRYVFTSDIFKYLDKIPRGAGGEYQLTDAIKMMAEEESVYGLEVEGKRYDTGSMEGYLEATIEFAMRDKNLASVIKSCMEKYK